MAPRIFGNNKVCEMNPGSCKVDVSVCVQSLNYLEEHSDLPKVTVSYDTLKVSVSEGHAPKFYKFNKIYQNFQDVLTSLCKSIKEDVDTGVNRILFLCKPLDNDVTSTMNMRNLNSTILNHLFTTVNDEANGEASLHVSCIEINNDGVFDLLNSDGISKDLKLFQIPNQNTEIRNLSEKSVTVENEIDDILETIFQKNKYINYTDCCHTVLSSMVIVKNKNSDGFECIKVSRLTMVDLTSCVHFLREMIIFLRTRRESFYSNGTDNSQMLNGKKYRGCCLDILKNSLSNSKISIILVLPSVLEDFKQSVYELETVSEIQNITIKPEVNEKLILRESLKDYAEEIKSLEKDLSAIKNANGISINKQKYRSLKNKLVLTEEQVKELSVKRKLLSDSVNNKKEILTRHQQEIKLIDSKIQEETQKLNLTKTAVEETKQRKIFLDKGKGKKIDACIFLKESIKSIETCVKNQNVHILKLKHQNEKSILNAKLLNEVITNYTKTTVLEQIKLKDNINSLLGYLKDALFNSVAKQHAYLMQAHDFYQNFEEMLNLWKQHSTNLVYDFGNFMEEVIHNCNSLRKKLCLEFMPLNSEQDNMIDIVMDCKNEMESMISCCTKDIQMSVEISMKLLFEILNLLEIVQVKMKEQLKALESSVYSCSKDQMQFLKSIYSSMQSVHQYFEEQKNFSLQINSKTVDYHQELKVYADTEFMKIKEALVSIRNLFNLQQKFTNDKWNQQQANLLETKQICEKSSELLKQCSKGYPNLLEIFGQQCIFSIDELHSIITDQAGTMDSSSNQLFDVYNNISSGIENFSEDSKKKIYKHESNMKDCLEIQNEKVLKCINAAHLMIEDIIECVNEGLQNTRNSVLSIMEHKTNNDVNHIISYLSENSFQYLSVYSSILKKNECTFEQLPEIVKKKIENAEESIEFNHEEVLSSTPSSHFEKPKVIIDEKLKLLNKLKKVATAQINSGNQSNSSLDWDFKLNESVKSLSNMGRKTKVEVNPNRSHMYRKRTK
ncbi:uncharacterized protein TNIN_433791 [Trichonephila inaurata madagascariensis]|uniref:Kinesin motor domain-containing protein n=1 Tax=Trichonephila inaurata madagascariensis TaxID=2747483 RepID=A0A8X6XEU4_9ARAC|nr:uncharacterized protein TNIN_433791 [Trichonephila inaurata madagascariensis]